MMDRRHAIFGGTCLALVGCGQPPQSSQRSGGTPVLSILRVSEVVVVDDSPRWNPGLDRLVGDLSGGISDQEVFQTVQSAVEREVLGLGTGRAARLQIGLSLLSIARPGGLNRTRIDGRFNLFSIEGNGIATVQGPAGDVLEGGVTGTPEEALNTMANEMAARLKTDLQSRSFR